jgi:hypothetical protein
MLEGWNSGLNYRDSILLVDHCYSRPLNLFNTEELSERVSNDNLSLCVDTPVELFKSSKTCRATSA